MSDNKDLGAFFKNANKKKNKDKKKTKETASSKKEEQKKEDAPIQKHSQQEDFAESSDEEKQEIKLDQTAIKDKKDVEARKRMEEEKDNEALGWERLGGANQDQQTKQADNEDKLKAAVSGSSRGGGITFGKPKFSKANKPINKMDFPELGAAGSATVSQAAEAGLSKKDQASIGNFGAGAYGAQPAARREEKSAPKMPIFRGKAKLNLGGPVKDSDVHSK